MTRSADLAARDLTLIRTVDEAAAEAARRSGSRVVCRPGCTPCCSGLFPISQLDAERLRAGLQELDARDPDRAARVRARAQQAWARLEPEFPGEAATGVLDPNPEERFPDWSDDEFCPALCPETGLCDLYTARPLTCRVFGPPLRYPSGDIGVCDLCFEGASEEEIAAAAVRIDLDALERPLRLELEAQGQSGSTVVAFALRA